MWLTQLSFYFTRYNMRSFTAFRVIRSQKKIFGNRMRLITDKTFLKIYILRNISQKYLTLAETPDETHPSSRGREVKAMDLKSIGVSPRRFESYRLRIPL